MRTANKMDPGSKQLLLGETQRLLNAIDAGDWETYQQLCDKTLSAFEPEALGQLVEGLDFHATYFTHRSATVMRRSIIQNPHVRLMDSVAVVCYTRLVQTVSPDGQHSSHAHEETRVWHHTDEQWKHVHFHRSRLGHVTLG